MATEKKKIPAAGGDLLVSKSGEQDAVVVERLSRLRAEPLDQVIHGKPGALLTGNIQNYAAVCHHQGAISQRQSLGHVVCHHETGDAVFTDNRLRQSQYFFGGCRIQCRRYKKQRQPD